MGLTYNTYTHTHSYKKKIHRTRGNDDVHWLCALSSPPPNPPPGTIRVLMRKLLRGSRRFLRVHVLCALRVHVLCALRTVTCRRLWRRHLTIEGRELAPRDGLAVICVYRSKRRLLKQSTALVLLSDFTGEAWRTFSKVSDLAHMLSKGTNSGLFFENLCLGVWLSLGSSAKLLCTLSVRSLHRGS